MQEHAWYFDIISPYAYLQWKQRERFANRLRLRPVPVLFAAILEHHGHKGPAEIESKKRFTYRTCLWRAARLGVPLRFPPAHPFNPINGLRLIIAAGATEQAVDAVYDAVFGDGVALADDVIIALGKRLGIDDPLARITEPAVKQELRANTDAAIAKGVFGVPTTTIGDLLFWGDDSTPMLLDYLEDPGIFDTPEMQRALTLKPSAVRKNA
ncbi:MAG: 2-hydroxychromene-2-carboxylate isomerase [Myxococcota bacterium]